MKSKNLIVVIFIIMAVVVGSYIFKTSQKELVSSVNPEPTSSAQEVLEPTITLPSLAISTATVAALVTASPTPSSSPKIIDGFVKVTDIDSSIIIDLKYATADNFTHTIVYPTDICILRTSTAKKLAKANAALKKLGYRIKVWDAYRPFSVQEIFWSIMPDSRYVANPANGGSVHNRGCAVDVTLVDLNGNEVEMPSEFDDFTENASPTNPDMSKQARANLDILRKAMTNSGFNTISSEWWHFDDSDRAKYTIADVDPALFE